MAGDSVNYDDIINILVATDTHLGYNENDRIRGKHRVYLRLYIVHYL